MSLRNQHLIWSTELGQPVSTFIAFAQSMIKGDHPRKRRELPNERKQVCMRMKVISLVTSVVS